ncbi:MAG: hypothetical protein JWP26_2470 [Devosia sp.]|nr:hypothetical protein [Devosia sp.]
MTTLRLWGNLELGPGLRRDDTVFGEASSFD